MRSVLIVGADGQLGSCIKDLATALSGTRFDFKDFNDLDITDSGKVLQVFSEGNYDYCINCAAYTAVDRAEEEEEKAFEVNAEATKYLAEASKQYEVVLIHVSTDFIFDGIKESPYLEDDTPNPLNVYGASKLKGEHYVKNILEKYFIIRTSWVYSEYGNNFVKTMLRLSESLDTLKVIDDQIGSPTYAKDLASFILSLIDEPSAPYGVFNFSNDAAISWFDFAIKIFELSVKTDEIKVLPISSESYPSTTIRPNYSVLDNEKRKALTGGDYCSWELSLKTCLTAILHEN